ncbi:hypothetical protein SLE2022_403510 [Rubroshorea leprosula]
MALGKGLTSFPKAPTTRTGEAASEKSSLIPRTGVLYIAMRSREGDHSLVTPNFLMPKPPRADSRLGYAILLRSWLVKEAGLLVLVRNEYP